MDSPRSQKCRVPTPVPWIIVILGILVVGLAGYVFFDRTRGAVSDEAFPDGKVVVLKRIDLHLVDKEGQDLPVGDVHADILCIDGFKYILLGQNPVSGITQVFEWDEQRQATVPVTCSEFVPLGLHQDQ
jgi:hypothetical protein